MASGRSSAKELKNPVDSDFGTYRAFGIILMIERAPSSGKEGSAFSGSGQSRLPDLLKGNASLPGGSSHVLVLRLLSVDAVTVTALDGNGTIGRLYLPDSGGSRSFRMDVVMPLIPADTRVRLNLKYIL